MENKHIADKQKVNLGGELIASKTDNFETPNLNKAHKIMKLHTILSMTLAFVPHTGLGLAAKVSIQFNMIKKISKLYQVTVNEQILKMAITSSISSIMSSLASYGIGKTLNPFQDFGHLAKGMTDSVVSGFLTAAIGKVYINHFETGGTLSTIQLHHFTDFLIEEIEKGEIDLASLTNPIQAISFLNK